MVFHARFAKSSDGAGHQSPGIVLPAQMSCGDQAARGSGAIPAVALLNKFLNLSAREGRASAAKRSRGAPRLEISPKHLHLPDI